VVAKIYRIERLCKFLFMDKNLGVVSTALCSFSDNQKFEIVVVQLHHDHFVIIRIITFDQESKFIHTYLYLIFRGVNLAQPIGFDPGPCGLGPKKSTLKKNPQQRSPQGQKPYKSPVGQGQPMGFHLPHEKYIIF